MNIKPLLFSLLVNKAELYLSKAYKGKKRNKQLKFVNSTISKSKKSKKVGSLEEAALDSEISSAIDEQKGKEQIAEPEPTFEWKEEFILPQSDYNRKNTAKAESKSVLRNLYESFSNYFSPKYKYGGKQKKKNKDQETWQKKGFEFSFANNLMWFPKKEKTVVGQLKDRGILVDYLNPAPVYCNL